MITALVVMSTLSFFGDVDSGRQNAMILVDTIESLQQPVEDFRCEFEGTMLFKGSVGANEKLKVGEDGLYESFSGLFIWKRGGDTYSDNLIRRAFDGTIARESLVVRMRENRAEKYYRLNDASFGSSVIKGVNELNSWKSNSLGYIFLIDKIKRDVADQGLEPSVGEENLDGIPL